MDYFQGVITEFLRATRSVFVNTEYLLQLDPGDVYIKDRHWYCDAVAINHATQTVQLCEVSFSKTLHSLVNRMKAWSQHWPQVVASIHRDSCLQGQWHVEPRVFIPQGHIILFESKMPRIDEVATPGSNRMPHPVITPMEDVLPWKYRSWNGKRFDENTDS